MTTHETIGIVMIALATIGILAQICEALGLFKGKR